MTINGSTNSTGWTYKLEVTETSTSLENRTSTIQVKTYIGRSNSRSYLGGNYSNSVAITGTTSQTQSGNIAYPTYINAGAWLLLKTFTFTVPNNDNPTTISINSTLNSSVFTPSYASASGTMQLTILHINPVINLTSLTEKKSKLLEWNVPNDTIVNRLSLKDCTFNVTLSNNANVIKVIQHSYLYSGEPVDDELYYTTSGNNITATLRDFRVTNYLPVIIESGNIYTEIKGEIQDTKGGKTPFTLKQAFIPYDYPTIERTSTTLIRKSPLTANQALLSFKGIIYKGNDVVGNHNTYKVEYKIWEKGDTEPQSYIDITSSSSETNGIVTIDNYVISNLEYTKQYEWRVKINDTAYYDVHGVYADALWGGTLTYGISTWSEYSDHVDFLKLTVGGYNPFEYSTNETKCGIWNDGYNEKPIYRKVIDFGYLPDASATKSVAHGISNLLEITKIETIGNDNGTFFPIPFAPVPFMFGDKSISIRVDSTNVNINTTADFTSRTAKVILEYTKTTD